MLLALLACAAPDDTGSPTPGARPLAYVMTEVDCDAPEGEYVTLPLPDELPLFVTAMIYRADSPWSAGDITGELDLRDGAVEVVCGAGDTVRLVVGVDGG